MRLGFATVLALFSFVAASADQPQRARNDDPLRPPAIETQSVPVVPRELAERLRQYQNTRAAMFQGWAPDGNGILVATRFGNTLQLHRVYQPGGRRDQITFFDEPVRGRFLPRAADDAIVFTMSKGGSEQGQIFLFEPQTGRSMRLTDGKSRNLIEAVSRDGTLLAISSNLRNGRDSDLYRASPRKARSMQRILTCTNETWMADEWSPDNSRLLIHRYVSINESYPALFDPQTGQKQSIPLPPGAPSGPAAFGPLKFSTNGRSLYLATDAIGEFLRAARVDLDTMQYNWLSDGISWDVEEIAVGPDGDRVAVLTNENAASGLYLLENGTRRKMTVPDGVVTGIEFSPDGRRLGFTLARPDSPADAYSMELRDGKLVRWTFSEVGGLNPKTFVIPQRIEFSSFDGRKIPAYVYLPREPVEKKKQPVPVLITIHGGPEGQYRPFFSGFEQFFLNEMGFAVIAPNVRGSAGYGKTFLKLDNAEKREDSVRDIGALLDWIATRPDLDAKRVAVMGGSYGGYMVLASLTHYSDRIRAGVDIVGVASFNTMLKTTSAYRRDLRRAEYGDERDPKMQAFFRRIDPLNNAEKIHSALLVAHGRNDPRVPFTEAQQITAKVRANGKTVWTVYAANEGHGFAKKPNRDYLNEVIALFLRENLAH